VIAVDTNILVYAHREPSPFHAEAVDCLTGLAEGSAPWAIPWPCLHEFISVVTHVRVFATPTPMEIALRQVDLWLSSPTVVPIAEGVNHWPALRRLLSDSRISGPAVHDAKIAVICLAHDVEELWTADRDFGRFPDLKVRNPLISR
jgi:toxin-antitoxin system PIN domain toxin